MALVKIMAVLTLASLRSAMEASGRPMSERKARDWLSKGLIPRPPRPGRGQGKGRPAYSWSNPRVLVQARVAHDLLERYPRAGADLACLSLWLLGFDIDLGRVRMAYDESAEHHCSMLDL